MRSLNYEYIQKIFENQLSPEFRSLVDGAIKNSEAVFKKSISLSIVEAQILSNLIQINQCQNFVEIGTLTGHSALWIMKALEANNKDHLIQASAMTKTTIAPTSMTRFYTFEKEQKHAQFAKEVIQKYDVSFKSEVIVGDALEMLKTIEVFGPFDGIFIDGNKSAYEAYLDWAEINLKKGALIVADNVFLSGQVFDELSSDIDPKKDQVSDGSRLNQKSKFSEKQVRVMKSFNKRLSDPLRYSSSIVPTEEGLFIAKKLF